MLNGMGLKVDLFSHQVYKCERSPDIVTRWTILQGQVETKQKSLHEIREY
jgi:hypothetical protein